MSIYDTFPHNMITNIFCALMLITESTYQQHRGGLVLLAGRICPSQRHAHLRGLWAGAQGLPRWAHARRVHVWVFWCCRSVETHSRLILELQNYLDQVVLPLPKCFKFATVCIFSRSPLWNPRARPLPAGCVELIALNQPHPSNTRQI